MTKWRLQVDTSAVFLRLAVYFFVLREAYVWVFRMRRMRARLGVRLVRFLFWKWATPHSVLYALLFAAAATTLLYLFVRLVLEPRVRAWLTPWTDGSAGLFHVAANERVLASSPGRRKAGRRWTPGTLVRTNLRLWFFPRAHDLDIWSQPLDVLRDVHLEPPPRIARGFILARNPILGWPERLSVQTAGDGQGDGDHAVFAIPDPDAVLAWFDRPDKPPVAVAPPLSSPRSL